MDISGTLGGLNLAHAWSHRFIRSLTTKWLVFKVDWLGGVEVFFPALSQYNLNGFFLAKT